MIAAMGAGGILGAIGGTGFKPARRFILPFILGLICLFAGFFWWKCLIVWVGLTGAFCLPYGEKVPYWGKFLVGCAFVAPTLALGFTWWQVINPFVFTGIFKLSNTKWAGTTFVWKICEFIFFSLIGITIANLIK